MRVTFMAMEMCLLSDRIGLREPGPKLRVELLRRREPKEVHVIPSRHRIDPSKSRRLETAREHEMTVQPTLPRRDLRERHSRLEGNARLLRENVNRTDPVDEAHELIEQRAHCRRPSDEVVVDRAEGRTRVRLMAIRELATTASAAPMSAWPPGRPADAA
jgi:hypothetical protein